MARVNVFLQDELLEEIDNEAKTSQTNRSALIQIALEDLLESRKTAREEALLREQRKEAGRSMDRLADKLGDWDPVRVIREQRDSRSRLREPARRYKAKRRKKSS